MVFVLEPLHLNVDALDRVKEIRRVGAQLDTRCDLRVEIQKFESRPKLERLSSQDVASVLVSQHGA